MIPADDRGFTLGDGLFETVLAEAGRLVCWNAHMSRMAGGAAALGLPAPEPDVLRREAMRVLAPLGDARAAVRISWSAGSGGRGLDRPERPEPRLVIAAAPASRPTTPARLHWASVRRNAGSPASRWKTLAYLDNVLARREAAAAGADEALMLNTDGAVACAAAANVFWLQNGVLRTPAMDCGVLEGVVRGLVLQAAPARGLRVETGSWGPEALGAAEAVFLTNSLIRVRPASFGPASEPHPEVRRLSDAVDALSSRRR